MAEESSLQLPFPSTCSEPPEQGTAEPPGLEPPPVLPPSLGSDFGKKTHHKPGEISSKGKICKV